MTSTHFSNISLTKDKQKILQSTKTYIKHVFVAIALPLPDMWTSIRKNTLSICGKLATEDCSQKRLIYQTVLKDWKMFTFLLYKLCK